MTEKLASILEKCERWKECRAMHYYEAGQLEDLRQSRMMALQLLGWEAPCPMYLRKPAPQNPDINSEFGPHGFIVRQPPPEEGTAYSIWTFDGVVIWDLGWGCVSCYARARGFNEVLVERCYGGVTVPGEKPRQERPEGEPRREMVSVDSPDWEAWGAERGDSDG